MARVAGAPLTDADCQAAGKGWLLNKGAAWFDGNYLNTLYNHHATPNARVADCIVYHDPGWKAARSHHPGGALALFADGHVEFRSFGRRDRPTPWWEDAQAQIARGDRPVRSGRPTTMPTAAPSR